MGYDVHITRRGNWFDKNGSGIGIDEWKALVLSDPDMRLEGHASGVVGGGSILRMESEGLAGWTAYAEAASSKNMVWFHFRRGNVIVKNPDGASLVKMWQLARKLDAKVQGDECEVYGADGNVIG